MPFLNIKDLKINEAMNMSKKRAGDYIFAKIYVETSVHSRSQFENLRIN